MKTGLLDRSLGSILDELSADACRAEVSRDVVRQARAATERVLACRSDSLLSDLQIRRAQAYYAAVVRRSIVRGSAGSRATARLVAAAVVADLHETGRDGAAIWHELERGWSQRIPLDVLEEYRLRLCG